VQPFLEDCKNKEGKGYITQDILHEWGRWAYKYRHALLKHDTVPLITAKERASPVAGMAPMYGACGATSRTWHSLTTASVSHSEKFMWDELVTLTHELGHNVT